MWPLAQPFAILAPNNTRKAPTNEARGGLSFPVPNLLVHMCGVHCLNPMNLLVMNTEDIKPPRKVPKSERGGSQPISLNGLSMGIPFTILSPPNSWKYGRLAAKCGFAAKSS